jgi:hypothetical protein
MKHPGTGVLPSLKKEVSYTLAILLVLVVAGTVPVAKLNDPPLRAFYLHPTFLPPIVSVIPTLILLI